MTDHIYLETVDALVNNAQRKQQANDLVLSTFGLWACERFTVRTHSIRGPRRSLSISVSGVAVSSRVATVARSVPVPVV